MNPRLDLSGTGSVVLVADSVRARVFAADAPDAELTECESLVNPEGRLHEGDLVEDSSGVRNNSSTTAKRSAFGGQSAKRHRAEEFAARVCERTADTLKRRRASRLYVVAEPEFLGILRQRMDRSLQRCVAGELAKSLTGQGREAIRAALPPLL